MVRMLLSILYILLFFSASLCLFSFSALKFWERLRQSSLLLTLFKHLDQLQHVAIFIEKCLHLHFARNFTDFANDFSSLFD